MTPLQCGIHIMRIRAEKVQLKQGESLRQSDMVNAMRTHLPCEIGMASCRCLHP